MSCVEIFKPQQLHWFVIIKARSPQLLLLQDLMDQLSRLRGNENDQEHLVYCLSYAVVRMICLTTGQAQFRNRRTVSKCQG